MHVALRSYQTEPGPNKWNHRLFFTKLYIRLTESLHPPAQIWRIRVRIETAADGLTVGLKKQRRRIYEKSNLTDCRHRRPDCGRDDFRVGPGASRFRRKNARRY